jgi:hypothetical protein
MPSSVVTSTYILKEIRRGELTELNIKCIPRHM